MKKIQKCQILTDKLLNLAILLLTKADGLALIKAMLYESMAFYGCSLKYFCPKSLRAYKKPVHGSMIGQQQMKNTWA